MVGMPIHYLVETREDEADFAVTALGPSGGDYEAWTGNRPGSAERRDGNCGARSAPRKHDILKGLNQKRQLYHAVEPEAV